ncbi:MAG: glutathione peroxidase [Candidatus Xenobia bacterium]
MRPILLAILLCLVISPAMPEASSFYDITVVSLDGKSVPLSLYQGQVTLVVNVASDCGFTPQYAGLEALHREFKARGFSVLGFPCNDFGGQEPGAPQEIQAFCKSRYDVTFPLFAKVRITSQPRSPVYQFLTAASGKTPNWNFGKYLVGKDGKVIRFFGSTTKPTSPELRQEILQALGT